MLRLCWAATLGVVLLAGGLAQAEDWPTFGHDTARSGITGEQLSTPLTQHWKYLPAVAPKPAWADPQSVPVEGIIEPPKVKFDDAFYTIAAEGLVFYGSSTENYVCALDAATGSLRWRTIVDGPVRLAPTYDQGRLYFGADDGYLYCLKAADGEIVWRRLIGPTGERLLGHGRMVSLWPVRTGVIVRDGLVYYTAGLFPGERVYVGAARASDGAPVWTNDTVDDGMGGQGNFSPQGYLLATDSTLYIPSGRSLPAAFNRADGKFLFQRGDGRWNYGVVGGAYALLAGDHLFGGTGQIIGYDQKTGAQGFAWFPGKRLLITADTSYMLNDAGITALDRVKYPEASRRLIDCKFRRDGLNQMRPRPADYQQRLDAIAADEKRAQADVDACTRFRYEHPKLESLILAGNTIFAAGQNEVVAVEAATGKQVWSAPVQGIARGLSVANGRLFVNTDDGGIYCFAAGQAPAAKPASRPDAFIKDALTPVIESAAESILKLSGVTRGYCLVLDSRTGRLAHELAKRSELTVYAVDSDPERVAAARKALCSAGLYGSRVTVDYSPDGTLPYSDYFANLVVSEQAALTGELPAATEQILRSPKPCGGVACLGQAGKATLTRAALTACLKDAQLGKPTVTEKNGVWATWTRGPLPGAGQWTHQYGDAGNTASSADTVLKCPLGVLWYGEPGPNKVPSRHLGNAAPLTINGRVYLQGINRLMCFDAYNGVPYWEREVPGAYRVGMVYEASNIACDDKSLFVVTGKQCLRLSAENGETLRTYDLPKNAPAGDVKWGWLAVAGNTLYGSVSAKAQESSMVFACDVDKGTVRWTFSGERIRNNTLALDEGRLFFADASVTSAQRAEALQSKISEIMNSGKISAAEAEKQLTSADVRLVTALEAASGKKLWQRPVDLTDCGPHVLIGIATRGVVVFCGAHSDGHYWPQFLAGEYGARRATVLSAKDGSLLWSKAIGYRIRPLVVGDELIAEPWSFDLKTGEQKQRTHPLTGESSPWQFERPGHHCGCISGSPNGLYFRSWSLAYYDRLRDNGTEHFGGQRPGCWINMIPANGLLVVPEASSGCICLVSIHCTTVFKPRETDRAWGGFSTPGACLPVKQVSLNLGAPGDRRASDGTLWISYPRPYGRMGLAFKPTIGYCKGGSNFAAAAENAKFANTTTPWVYASGCRGLSSLSVPLVGKLDGPALYTVRLGFVETDNTAPGRRVFDIKLQGQTVEKQFEALAAAGQPRTVVVREFKGIPVEDELKIELVSPVKEPAPEQMPILNSVEIIRERVLHVGLGVPELTVSDPQPQAEGVVQLSNRTDHPFSGTLKLTAPTGLSVTPAELPVTLAVNGQLSLPVKVAVAQRSAGTVGKLKAQLLRADETVETEREAALEYLGPRGRMVIPASADTYVSAGSGATNYGHSANLLVDGGSQRLGDESHNIALLRFPLRVPGRIVSLRLRIHTTPSEASESGDSGKIYLTDVPWDENKVTYEKRPALGAEVAVLGQVARNAWEERGLKVDLQGRTELNLVLEPTGCDGANYISREGGTAPELVVEFEPAK